MLHFKFCSILSLFCIDLHDCRYESTTFSFEKIVLSSLGWATETGCWRSVQLIYSINCGVYRHRLDILTRCLPQRNLCLRFFTCVRHRCKYFPRHRSKCRPPPQQVPSRVQFMVSVRDQLKLWTRFSSRFTVVMDIWFEISNLWRRRETGKHLKKTSTRL